VAPSYEDLLASLRSGDLHLAQLSAAAFVRARGVISGQVLAQQRMEGATEYRGAFVAKKGAFKGLTELKGKRFAFVDRHSSAGYWYPRIKLRANGFNPDEVFGEVIFAGSHARVLAMVRAGDVDAGAVSEPSLAGADDLEALEVTGAIPDDVIVAVAGLSQEEQERLRALLLGAAESPALTATMKERRIRAFVPHAFDEYAMLEMELRLSGALLGGAPTP
jgi:phosphonate transport system substrate-binding protein